jgi:uncharacterized protein (DUF58 family)
VRLTRRGLAVLVAGVVLLLYGQWGGYPFPRVLGAVLLAVVLVAVLHTARRLTVRVRRSVYPDRVERGRPALASLRVANPGTRRIPGFLATDAVGGATRTIRVRALPAGAEAFHHYELPTGARGRTTVGPLVLHRVDPFGLARNRLPTGDTAPLWVHPRQLPARPLAGAYPRHHHEGATTDPAVRGSADLQDVREYVPGDEVRHLHWKATARTGRLMVRDLADPQQPRFTLLLDTRPQALSAPGFEEAVDVAASLLAAAARAGHHSRLVTSGGGELRTAGGVRAARLLLDELCELRQDEQRGGGLVPGALSASGTAGGGLVVVTAGTELASRIAALRPRFAPLVVMDLGVPGTPGTVPGGRVIAADSADQAVQRWNEVLG